MKNDLINSLEQIEKEKGISKHILLEAIQDALLSALKKNFGNMQSNLTVNIDNNTGQVKVIAKKKVVNKVADPQMEVSHKEAMKRTPDCAIGDLVSVEVNPDNFGRIAAQTAKQVIVQRIREAERDMSFREFAGRKGEIVTGIVQRMEQNKIYIELGKIEAFIPSSEQVPVEKYRPGDRIKAYIFDVKLASKGPQVLLSRSNPAFLNRLFELEVPEIYEKIVEIKSAAREPGYRSKIAVASNQEGVDPVGACVGARGARVLTVVQELKGEKIDIVLWDKDPCVFIANALNPAKVLSVELGEHDNSALVVVPDNQLSLAIGKEGQNARLAAKLTGWKIDIKNKTNYDEEVRKNKLIDELIESILEKFSPLPVVAVEVKEKDKVILLTCTFEDYLSAFEKKKDILLDEPWTEWSIKIQPPLKHDPSDFPMDKVAEIFMNLLDPIPIVSLELNKNDRILLIGIFEENINDALQKQKDYEALTELGDWKIVMNVFVDNEL